MLKFSKIILSLALFFSSIFLYGPLDPFVEGDLRFPAEGVGAGRIHEFAVHAVGFRGVPFDFALEPGGGGNLFRQLPDRDVAPIADVDYFGFVMVLHEIIDGVRNIVHVQKLPQRRTGSPKHLFRFVLVRRRHKPPHERREHMAVFRIVVVVGSVEVARHQAHRVPAVLFTQVQTEFVAGDLRQGVPLVGRFQRSGEKILLFDRLRRTARIDAARSQKTELLQRYWDPETGAFQDRRDGAFCRVLTPAIFWPMSANMATAEQVVACDYVGIESGNQVANKLEKAGWHTVRSEFVDAPLIDELPMAVECRLVSYDPESCRLVGEIVNVSADESVLDEDGKIDPDKLRPITFDPIHHVYRVLGEKVANAFQDGAKLK